MNSRSRGRHDIVIFSHCTSRGALLPTIYIRFTVLVEAFRLHNHRISLFLPVLKYLLKSEMLIKQQDCNHLLYIPNFSVHDNGLFIINAASYCTAQLVWIVQVLMKMKSARTHSMWRLDKKQQRGKSAEVIESVTTLPDEL